MAYEDLNKYLFFFKKICITNKKDILNLEIMPGSIRLDYTSANDAITRNKKWPLFGDIIICKKNYFEYNGQQFSKQKLDIIREQNETAFSIALIAKFCDGEAECVQCHTKYVSLICETCGLHYESRNSAVISAIFNDWPYQYDYEYSDETKNMLSQDIKDEHEWLTYYNLLYINTAPISEIIKKYAHGINNKLSNINLLTLNSLKDDIKGEHSDFVINAIQKDTDLTNLKYLLYITAFISFMFDVRISWDADANYVISVLKKCVIPIMLMIVGIILLNKKRLDKKGVVAIILISFVIYNFFLLDEMSSWMRIIIVLCMFASIPLFLLLAKNHGSQKKKSMKTFNTVFTWFIVIMIFLVIVGILIIVIPKVWNSNYEEPTTISPISWINILIGLLLSGIIILKLFTFWRKHVDYLNARNRVNLYWKYLIPKQKKSAFVGLLLLFVPSLLASSLSDSAKGITFALSILFTGMILPSYTMTNYENNVKSSPPEILKATDMTELKTNENIYRANTFMNDIITNAKEKSYKNKTSQVISMPKDTDINLDINENKHNTIPRFSRNNILWPTRVVSNIEIPGDDSVIQNTLIMDHPELINMPIEINTTTSEIDPQEDIILPEGSILSDQSEASLQGTDVPDIISNLTHRREKDIRELRVEKYPKSSRMLNYLFGNRGRFI